VADDTHALSRPLTVPDSWTVDQAEAVLDFLFVLEAAVFNAYERPIVERAIREASGPHPVDVYDDADPETDNPFPF
jgi:hypothetical protein